MDFSGIGKDKPHKLLKPRGFDRTLTPRLSQWRKTSYETWIKQEGDGKMALFLELTGGDDVKQFVNVEQITHLARYGKGGGAFTRIDFDHNNVVDVKETPQDILARAKLGGGP